MSSPLLVVAFDQEAPAKLLIDYMVSQGVGAYYVIDQQQDGHGVAVRETSELEKARYLAEEFVRDPGNKRYQKAAWEHGHQLHSRQNTGASAFKNLINFAATPFTSLVLVICVVTFVLSLLGMFPIVRHTLQILSLEQIAQSNEWWRVITPAFIHFSAVHIIFNLLWWWMLGGQIERKFGSSTLALLFLLSAVFSNLGQYLVSGPNFGGLSGVVYAVIGFVWWIGILRPSWGLSIQKPVIGFLLVWLVLGYADLLWVSMANTAHTLGLISGCVFAMAISRLKSKAPGKLTDRG